MYNPQRVIMPIATPAAPHPHLPIPLGDLSVWQRSTRDHPLLNQGKDGPLPSEADVVIVGSGMCGGSIFYELPIERGVRCAVMC